MQDVCYCCNDCFALPNHNCSYNVLANTLQDLVSIVNDNFITEITSCNHNQINNDVLPQCYLITLDTSKTALNYRYPLDALNFVINNPPGMDKYIARLKTSINAAREELNITTPENFDDWDLDQLQTELNRLRMLLRAPIGYSGPEGDEKVGVNQRRDPCMQITVFRKPTDNHLDTPQDQKGNSDKLPIDITDLCNYVQDNDILSINETCFTKTDDCKNYICSFLPGYTITKEYCRDIMKYFLVKKQVNVKGVCKSN